VVAVKVSHPACTRDLAVEEDACLVDVLERKMRSRALGGWRRGGDTVHAGE
jgi:hypothetical protein